MKRSKKYVEAASKVEKNKLYTVEEAMKVVAGTAKNMGIKVEGQE